MNNRVRAGWPAALWTAFLAATGLTFTICFACITPLAGIAAVAAATLSRRAAVVAVLLVWAANQAAGFLLLDYPQTANAYEWGAVLGLATLAALAVSDLSLNAIANRVAGPVVAVVAAFAVFEIALYVASVAALGGMDGYGAETIMRVAGINASAASLLFVLRHVGLPRLGLIGAARAAG
jgi:hypothetical protein